MSAAFSITDSRRGRMGMDLASTRLRSPPRKWEGCYDSAAPVLAVARHLRLNCLSIKRKRRAKPPKRRGVCPGFQHATRRNDSVDETRRYDKVIQISEGMPTISVEII